MSKTTPELRVAAQIFAAVGQPMRLGALYALVAAGDEGLRFPDIALALAASHASLAKHLRVLETERLVRRREGGGAVIYAIRPEGLASLRSAMADLDQVLPRPAGRGS